MDGFTKDELPQAEDVILYMEENAVPTRRRQMSYNAMKVIHNIRGNHAESKKYAMPLLQCKRKLQQDYDKQERTERQKSNWIDYTELKCQAKKLREEAFKLPKGELWDKEQYARAQLAFILTFHMKYPIRRDLCTVKYEVYEWCNVSCW